jgi:hypothetical protein
MRDCSVKRWRAELSLLNYPLLGSAKTTLPSRDKGGQEGAFLRVCLILAVSAAGLHLRTPPFILSGVRMASRLGSAKTP